MKAFNNPLLHCLLACLLAGCQSLSPNTTIGYEKIAQYDKYTVDKIVVDGVTSKSDIVRFLGTPINTARSGDIDGLLCKRDAEMCIFGYIFGSAYAQSFGKTLMVYFDKNNIAVSHQFIHTVNPR
jgi:outer membrane protein assembly factor BamE (lipoprotein component of BamABCDE complex)